MTPHRPITAYLSEQGSSAVIIGRKIAPDRPAQTVQYGSDIDQTILKQAKGYSYASYGSGQKEWMLLVPFDCQQNVCKSIYDKSIDMFKKSTKSRLYVMVIPNNDQDGQQSNALVQFYCEKTGLPKGVHCQTGKVSVEMVKKIFAAMKINHQLPVAISPDGEVIPLRTLDDIKVFNQGN